MATANVKLYYGTAQKPWLLTANKFFVIDDIASYLATFTPTELSNFQYLKPTLELSIVCDLSQTYTEPLLTNGIKYVAIKNSDANKTYYYYVKSAEWRGKQSVKLFLVMDVANTFKSGIDFEFTERTKITREHKDRMEAVRNRHAYFNMDDVNETAPTTITNNKILMNLEYTDTGGDTYDSTEANYYSVHGASGVLITYIYDDTLKRVLIPFTEYNPVPSSWDFDVIEDEYPNVQCSFELEPYIKGHSLYISITGFYNIPSGDTSIRTYRKIDLQSEGLSPLLYKKSEETINRSGLLNVDWYLLYRNQNNPTEALTNPVECYLIPSSEIPVNIGSIQTGGRINASNLEYGKYYYIPLDQHGNSGMVITLSNGVQITRNETYNVSYQPFIVVQKASDNAISVDVARIETGQGDAYNTYTQYITEYFNVSILPCNYMISDTWRRPTYATFVGWSMTGAWTSEGTSPRTLDSIDKLDRTDAKNIKLIKLPYVPYDFQVSDNKLIITDTDFDHISLTQSGGGVIEILKLKNMNIKFNYNFLRGGSPLGNLILNIQKTTLQNLSTSRSNWFESKIFHSDYYQEKFVYDSFGYVFMLERMDLSRYKSLTDTAKMNLTIKYVVSTTITSKFMFQFPDFYSRNGKEDYDNVMPIARNNEMVLYNVPYINYIRTGYNYDVKNKNTQTISSWASVGLGAVGTATSLLFPTAALKIAGVVASLISTALSVKNAVVNQVQAERNLDQKMLEAKNQTTSVGGADDVDLMSVYTGNRAKMCKYECSDIIKNLLFDLFFYTGYVGNRMGIPDTNSRLNFNYLEADIVITDNVNMSDEIMNELIGLYKNGLTFIHKVSSRTTDPWDLEQKYENFEKSLLYL